MGKFDFIHQALEQRKRQFRMRRLRPVQPAVAGTVDLGGHRMLNFCSNDYLGLSQHPLLKARAMEYIRKFGNGATASRLICGTYTCVAEVEKKLARLKQAPAALIFNSGFQANISLLPALTTQQSIIFSDELNHNSIIQGARLSRCRIARFRHNDLSHLEMLLKEHRQEAYQSRVIVTESVFSMDGDQSDIQRLIELAEAYESLLIVDEAHATGVLGLCGMGLTAGKSVDIVMGTFSKGCGAFGAYVTCQPMVRDYLVNYSSGLIYSTALPPAVIGAIDAALDLIPTMGAEREMLHTNSAVLRSALNAAGWSTKHSTTQIIPVMVGDDKKALDLAAWLEERGVLALAIRPPSVPEGEARIRLSVSAAHTREHIDEVIRLFKKQR